MPAPTNAKGYKLGPGTLTLGETTSLIDVSCQATGVILAPDVDAGDPVKTVGGCDLPGSRTYNWTLSGTFLTDLDAAGVNAFCDDHKGEQVPFSWAPNTADGGTAKATGTLVVDPLPFGGEEAGAWMEAEFEFTVVGDPTFTWNTAAAP